MPLPILPILIEALTLDRIVGAIKWSMDRLKSLKPAARAEVEARIRKLSLDLANSARYLAEAEIDSAVSRLFDQFQKDVQHDGISAEDAQQLAMDVRVELEASVIGPAKERRQTLQWMQELEARANQAETAIEGHKAIEKRLIDIEKKVTNLSIALGVALTLGTISSLLTVLLLTRK